MNESSPLTTPPARFAANIARLSLLFLAMTVLFVSPLHGAEYQWSVTMARTNPGNRPEAQPRAFLWIPPTCNRIRGVVLAEHNMLEEGILESPIFRQTLTDLDFAEIWITPSFDPVFLFDKGAGALVDKLMRDLAAESGYQELAFVPIAPLGHSAHASFPWNFAAWNPGRTLAILSVHGDAPLTDRTGSGRPNPDWGDRSIDGVPGVMAMGEYEWHEDRLEPALAFRRKHPGTPLSVLADAGHGHFDHSTQLVAFLSLFLRKAAFYRLPAQVPLDRPAKLIAIDPRNGWLLDRWRQESAPTAPAAPFASYTGDPKQAFWSFDKETAEATQNFNSQRGRLPQLLGFEQAGKTVPQHQTGQQLSLPFQPDADGITFHMRGVFLDSVPPGNPVSWTGMAAGSPIGHAAGGGPVMISRIEGAVAQAGPQDWSVSFNRGTDVADPTKQTDEVWFVATQEGDDRYKSAVQQAQMVLPMRNRDGAAQHLAFAPIKDQTNLTASLRLQAASDANLPVSYYVREGPAEVSGADLVFSAIPPRAKYPIKVTVVAWQYGRAAEPKVQSAKPVIQTFYITEP